MAVRPQRGSDSTKPKEKLADAPSVAAAAAKDADVASQLLPTIPE